MRNPYPVLKCSSAQVLKMPKQLLRPSCSFRCGLIQPRGKQGPRFRGSTGMDDEAYDAALGDDTNPTGDALADLARHNMAQLAAPVRDDTNPTGDALADLAQHNMAQLAAPVQHLRGEVLANVDLLVSAFAFLDFGSLNQAMRVNNAWRSAAFQTRRVYREETRRALRLFLGPPARWQDFRQWIVNVRPMSHPEGLRAIQELTPADLVQLRAPTYLFHRLSENTRWTRFAVAGRRHHQTAITESGARALLQHRPLCAALRSESTNPVDENAVKVVIGDFHVGYLRAVDAKMLTNQERATWTAMEAAVVLVQEKVEDDDWDGGPRSHWFVFCPPVPAVA